MMNHERDVNKRPRRAPERPRDSFGAARIVCPTLVLRYSFGGQSAEKCSWSIQIHLARGYLYPASQPLRNYPYDQDILPATYPR